MARVMAKVIKKETLAQVFHCEFYETPILEHLLQNTYFTEHLRTTASVNFQQKNCRKDNLKICFDQLNYLHYSLSFCFNQIQNYNPLTLGGFSEHLSTINFSKFSMFSKFTSFHDKLI